MNNNNSVYVGQDKSFFYPIKSNSATGHLLTHTDWEFDDDELRDDSDL